MEKIEELKRVGDDGQLGSIDFSRRRSDTEVDRSLNCRSTISLKPPPTSNTPAIIYVQSADLQSYTEQKQ